MKSAKALLCACESGKTYAACCKIYHDGASAPTAELLMRSRYTAYTLSLEPYLLTTWHPETRPTSLNLTENDRHILWLGLQIKATEQLNDTEATVTFVARFKDNAQQGKAERMLEKSHFIRLNEQWFYHQAL